MTVGIGEDLKAASADKVGGFLVVNVESDELLWAERFDKKPEAPADEFLKKAEEAGIRSEAFVNDIPATTDNVLGLKFDEFMESAHEVMKTFKPAASVRVMESCLRRAAEPVFSNRPFFTNYGVRLRVTEKLRARGLAGDPGWDDVNSVRDECIREMAYSFWELERNPDGRHLDNWVEAERQFDNAMSCWSILGG
jgi:hypothetical protein